MDKIIWTIGHSTRGMSIFLTLLAENNIQLLADVRRFPGSRKFPHFDKVYMKTFLPENGIGYIHLPGLGGRRKGDVHSSNTAWRNPSFRNYADYMATGEFEDSIHQLERLAQTKRTCFMCSEAVWWRCHRALVADYLKVSGWHVLHILSPDKVVEHPYTSAAKIIAGQLSYAD